MPIKDEPFEPLFKPAAVPKKIKSCPNLQHVNYDGFNINNLLDMRNMFPSHPQLTHTQRQSFLNNGWVMSDGGSIDD